MNEWMNAPLYCTWNLLFTFCKKHEGPIIHYQRVACNSHLHLYASAGTSEPGVEQRLAWLECPDDFGRCAAVSKACAAAAVSCQPQALRFSNKIPADEETKMVCCQLSLLQTWQRQGRLQALTQLYVDNDRKEVDFIPYGSPSSLSQGVILLAGLWNLSICRMYGPFCLEAAASLLPTTLLGLSMWPDSNSGRRVIRLSAFKRLSKLQLLKLGVGPESDFAIPPPNSQVLLDTPLPCLQHVIMHDRLHCTLAQGITLEARFPNVHTLHIRVNPDDRGRSLVQGALALPKLEILTVDVVDAASPLWQLIVPKSSSVQKLFISAPPHKPFITIQLQKADIHYRCTGVVTVSSACASISVPPLSYYDNILRLLSG